MTTTALRTRRARGIHPKRPGLQQSPRGKGSNLPEYLEKREIEAMIAAAPNPMARLLMLEQWRAGLRVSEALALEKRDLFLDSDRPTLRVRLGKGNKARVVVTVQSWEGELAEVGLGMASGGSGGYVIYLEWMGKSTSALPTGIC